VTGVEEDGGAEPRPPFVETRAGGWFFLNAVLVGPSLLVLWPVLLRAVLHATGAVRGPSNLLDPVPELAASTGPYVAWLSALPLVSTLLNLRLPMPPAARWALGGFAAVHVGVLAWWAVRVLG
jgi:hypothetical protein